MLAAGGLWWSGMSVASPPAALVSIPPPQMQERASTQLDQLGMPLDGDYFVRAIATAHRPLVDRFLAAGVDVNATDAEGRTPLFTAIATQQWDLMRTLLGRSADPRGVDNHGRTALMAAALHGKHAVVADLLERGADARVVDEHGHSALHYAVVARHHPVIAHLLAHDLMFTGPCCDGRDLFTHALETNEWPIIEQILERHPRTLRWNTQSRQWLSRAITMRDRDRIRLLLSRHTAAPTPEGRRQPLLAYALLDDDRELFDLLLECGADPNTPLETPAEKVFVDRMPPVTVRHYVADEPGMNVLMLAAGLGRPQYVKALLDNGASRSIPTHSKHKLVPIYFASWSDNAESIQMLIANAPSPEKMRIDVSIASQRATLFKNGAPVFETDISSGRSDFPTPRGSFVVTDKKRHHISSIYKVKMPNFLRLSCKDFGMHEGYIPGYPASHGCIRLPAGASRKLFNEVPIGTLVTIR